MGPNWGTHPYSAMAEYCVPLPAGGYECDFVDPIPESLSCPICLLAFRDPHILDCCGAKYCEPCIGRVKAAGQPCPLCKQQFTSLVDRNDQRRVLNLKVRCSRKKDGCQWAGEVRHLSDHERNECMWALVECQYHCGERAPRHHLIQHQQDECPQRPVDVKLESFMRKMETKLTAEKERHKEEMAAVNEAVKEMEKNYTREMAGMKEDHMKEMATMRDDHMKEMAAIRKEITSATEMVKREMATVRDDHVKEMATMRKDMATLRETEKHITGETATAKKNIMKEMAALKKDYTKEMASLREKEMAVEKHHNIAMVAVKEDHKKELASLREELKKMNQQMAERQQSMDKKLAKHREIEAEHASKLKEMKTEYDSRSGEIRKLKQMIATNEADMQQKPEKQEKKIKEPKCSRAEHMYQSPLQVDRAHVPKPTFKSASLKCPMCGCNNGSPMFLGMCKKCYKSRSYF